MSGKNETKLEAEEQIDVLKFINERNVSLIELADNKASTILVITGIMLTAVFALVGFIPSLFSFVTVTDYLRIAFFGIYFAATGGCIIFAILTISPLTDTGILPQKDIFYYKQILQYKNKEEYADDVEEKFKDIPLLMRLFAYQIYAVSLVNERKYKNLRRSILFLASSFVMFICLIAVSFL